MTTAKSVPPGFHQTHHSNMKGAGFFDIFLFFFPSLFGSLDLLLMLFSLFAVGVQLGFEPRPSRLGKTKQTREVTETKRFLKFLPSSLSFNLKYGAPNQWRVGGTMIISKHYR